ncbi:carbamoyltransferase [soil metagenome]
MTTWILGISALYHDSAVALLRDGNIEFAAQEERFTRRKNDPGFPANALATALKTSQLTPADIDYVVYYENPWKKFSRVIETYAAGAPRQFAAFGSMLHRWSKRNLASNDELAALIGDGFAGKVAFVDHHASHAASAFFPSPFSEAAILTLDAVGEWSTTSIGFGRGNEVVLTHELQFPHSIGMLYSALTSYLGFEVNEGEYKVMGLAPYGKPTYLPLLEQVARVDETGAVGLDMTYFSFLRGNTMTSERFHALFGSPPRERESRLTVRHLDLAASIQRFTEDIMLKCVRHVHRLNPVPNLVLAGGVALNCVGNGRIQREGPFANVWIQPAAGDAGGALGAAYLGWHHLLGKPRVPCTPDAQKGSLLGPRFSNTDIGVYLDGVGARYERIDDEAMLLDRVARLLDGEQIIGWFQGRLEYGPRSLGCRSIIGDPRPPDMQSRMNRSIKFRESFRPFAPCVLKERAHEVFTVPPGEDSAYMLSTWYVRDDVRIPLDEKGARLDEDPDLMTRLSIQRSKLPAITHVDYSARIQTVDEERHGRFYRLLNQFHALTSCPVIVNTSFNVRGEPIVCTPEDALHCFMKTDMDCLVLENYVLEKQAQPADLAEHIKLDY